jgi:hypothetical protein
MEIYTFVRPTVRQYKKTLPIGLWCKIYVIIIPLAMNVFYWFIYSHMTVDKYWYI